MKTDKHVFFVIRYSVVLKKRKNSWLSGRDASEFKEYKEIILNSNRLEKRRFLFDKITLSSIYNQKSNVPFTVLILTSEDLPKVEKQWLEEKKKVFPNIEIAYLSENEGDFEKPILSEVKKLKPGTCYATVRIDDDDALSTSYLTSLESYLNGSFSEKIVSFGRGYAAIYSSKNNELLGFKDYYYPKIAIGLALIGVWDSNVNSFFSIYKAGNHTKVDQFLPTILDSRNRIFIRTIHDDADTHGVHDKKISKMLDVETGLVKRDFKFDLLCGD